MPQVSVILSTYNNERYLKSAIRSILRQTFTDFELIVVNDGSTDRTADILRHLRDSRLRVITHQHNQGKVASCNQAIRQAQGEFIARMDGDDLIHPCKLAAQVAYLRQHPQVVLIGTRMKRIGGRTYHYPLDHATISASLLVENVISQPSVMWRRQFFLQHQLHYDPHFDVAEDYDLWTRVAQIGQIANLPQVYHYYRWHPHQESHLKRAQQNRHAASIVYRQLRRLLPQVQRDQILFWFDFSQAKTVADLKDVSQLFTDILTANAKNQLYSPSILASVLAAKYLSFCSNSAFDLRRQAWQLWRRSPWRPRYRGHLLRVYWLYFKCHFWSPLHR
jgi:glycosyltransferase involved in cell wall biosynthesis